MRAIILLFLAIACLSIGITAYFALGFTIIEAFLATIVAALASVVLIEGVFRRRTETYLVKQTEEVARQLASIAKTTELVSDQVKFLSDLNLKERTDNLEADVSVLGTVVRQLAEAVAEVEEAQANFLARADMPASATPKGPELNISHSPVPTVPIEIIQKSLLNNAIEQYLQPIVTLPQRKTLGYELLPKLVADDGNLHDADAFVHYDDATGTMAELERVLIYQATNIIHRSNVAGEPTTIFVPITSAILRDKANAENIIEIFKSNRAIALNVMLMTNEAVFNVLTDEDRDIVKKMVRFGAGICLDKISSLRLPFQQLVDAGVKYVKADAQRFLDNPLNYTDYHRADIADYVERFGIGLIMDNVGKEEHVLELLDDKIPYAQGSHIAMASPVRPDLAEQEFNPRVAAR